MIKICKDICLNENEIELAYIRSPGPGGQNVNKLATAVVLRFNVKKSSSLPDEVKARLEWIARHRINAAGELIIKAVRHRTQERNKQDALSRLKEIILQAIHVPKKRKKSLPTFASQQERLAKKKLRAKTKSLRQSKPDLE